ncbi:response regulator [Dyadobacter diqingensis]|jgi:CheY-like chemotaxis protein|uniref:response regulator n=1 Tax=Dyadobacter diqingensis TaxID=2938121 RepID=UPI0020C1B0A5|nr:response regulator [Dyadobacter diqingensis]
MKPKIIYIADDDEDDRLFISDAIRKLDLEIKIVEAADGDDLLHLIESENTEEANILILLDMNMPRVTGIEVLQTIRANNKLKHIPAVMISTSSDKTLIDEAYQTGINAFIKKPNNYDGFIKIAQALQTCFFDFEQS